MNKKKMGDTKNYILTISAQWLILFGEDLEFRDFSLGYSTIASPILAAIASMLDTVVYPQNRETQVTL